jgi:hypothetical protein
VSKKELDVFLEGVEQDYHKNVLNESDGSDSIRNKYRLTDLTESWMFSLNEDEIDQDVENIVQDVMKNAKYRNADLNFGPAFPNERTYIRLGEIDDESSLNLSVPQDIKDFLDGKGYEVDNWKEGMAKHKNLANKKMRIGKLVGKRPDLKKMFDQRLGTGKKDTGDLVAVFSYNPRDIATMSTGRGWTSCADLSKGGVAAEQIPNKIAKGGMVAYLINAKDKEIKNPIARISIRRFVSMSDGSFILLPEKACYGADVPEFEDLVLDVLQGNNEETSQDEFGIFKDAEGGYSDSFRGYVDQFGQSSGIEELIDSKWDSGDINDWSRLMQQHLDDWSNEEIPEPLSADLLYKFINQSIERNNIKTLHVALNYLNDVGRSSNWEHYPHYFEGIDFRGILENEDGGEMLDYLLREQLGGVFNVGNVIDLINWSVESNSKTGVFISKKYNSMLWSLMMDSEWDLSNDAKREFESEVTQNEGEHIIARYVEAAKKSEAKDFETKEIFEWIDEAIDDLELRKEVGLD